MAISSARHAIVVPGAPVDASGRPRGPLRERLERARLLAEGDPEALVVVTGGVVRGRVPEAPAMARWLTDRGIDPERIVVEQRARSTIENADLVAPLLEELGVARVTIVSQRLHALRARFNLGVALRRGRHRRVALSVSAAVDPSPRRVVRLANASAELFKLFSDAVIRLAPPIRHYIPGRADRRR